MLTYDEFKEAMDKGFIKGDTVQIVRKNGKSMTTFQTVNELSHTKY